MKVKFCYFLFCSPLFRISPGSVSLHFSLLLLLRLQRVYSLHFPSASHFSSYDTRNEAISSVASTDCSIVSYYVSIYDYVKTQYNGTVVINPGQETNECFMAACDIVMNAENSFSAYIQPYSKFEETTYLGDEGIEGLTISSSSILGL